MMKIWNSVDHYKGEHVWVTCKYCQHRELVKLRGYATHSCCNNFMRLEFCYVFIILAA